MACRVEVGPERSGEALEAESAADLVDGAQLVDLAENQVERVGAIVKVVGDDLLEGVHEGAGGLVPVQRLHAGDQLRDHPCELSGAQMLFFQTLTRLVVQTLCASIQVADESVEGVAPAFRALSDTGIAGKPAPGSG